MEDEQLSVAQVWDVLSFAKQATSFLGGYLSPSSINDKLKQINMNPYQASESQILQALKDPRYNEQLLRRVGESFEYVNMIYKRIINYSSGIPAFDLSWECINANDVSDYTSNEYKKSLNAMYSFLDKFDYKKEFKRVAKQVFRQEAMYVALRKDYGGKYVLQELPIDYCMITGKDPYGLQFDFNTQWFISGTGVNINQYPPVFKKYVSRVQNQNNVNNYKISPQEAIRNKNYVYWTQTSHADGMWVFKLDEERAGHVPFYSAMYPDLYNGLSVRRLQLDKYIIQASKILIGLYPLIKNPKSANVADMMSIDPVTMGKFIGLVNSGLPDQVKMTMAPLEDVKSFDETGNGNVIMDEYNKTTAASSGINSRMIYAHDKMNLAESQSSIDVDVFLSTAIYRQCADFMNYNANDAESKYQFAFTFEGSEFTNDRKERLAKAMQLATVGIVLPHKIANSLGMDKRTLDRQLAESSQTNWIQNLTLLPSVHTQSAGDNKGGAPQKDASLLSETGENSRNNDSLSLRSQEASVIDNIVSED